MQFASCSMRRTIATLPLNFTELKKGSAEKTMVFLHGILGRGNNWHHIANKFVTARPDWRALLVDLRAHGKSTHVVVGDDTVAQCARDLADMRCDAIVGHSFGGKVALQYAAEHDVENVFLIDSAPGAKEKALWIMTIFDYLKANESNSYSSRKEFVERAVASGFDISLAQWLVMNLEAVGGEFRHKLDMRRIETLYEDYCRQNLWSAVGKCPTFLVIGDKSMVYNEEERKRAFDSGPRVSARILNAGHNVHMDAPEELIDILTTETS